MKGFTLTEMLITMTLGLLLVTMLLKVYFWQLDIHHKIEDIVFLDHNGVLAVNTIKNVNDPKKFKLENQYLCYLIDEKNESNKRERWEKIIPGVERLVNENGHITIALKAPYGMKASYSK